MFDLHARVSLNLSCRLSVLAKLSLFAAYIASPFAASGQTVFVPTIATIAGDPAGIDAGYSGDNSPAYGALLNNPGHTVSDAQGNMYFADANNSVVRRIDAKTGFITTVAGSSYLACSLSIGDGGAATAASLCHPGGVAIDASGNLYIADTSTGPAQTHFGKVRMVAPGTGIITTIASGMNTPGALALDGRGNLFVLDTQLSNINKLVLSTGLWTRYAGDGIQQYLSGPLAINAAFNGVSGIACDAFGNLYVTEKWAADIRVILASDLTIHIIAGVGTGGNSGVLSSFGNGGLAISSHMQPTDVWIDPAGNVYLTERYIAQVRKISVLTGGANPNFGVINAFAGDGSATSGYRGDLGPALTAKIAAGSVSGDSLGNVYISEGSSNNHIRKVSLATSFATTSVGSSSAAQTLDALVNTADTLSTAGVPASFTDFTSGTVVGTPGACTLDSITSTVAGTSCAVPVTFKPQVAGLQSAPVIIGDTSLAISTIGVTGIGSAPSIAYTPGTIGTISGTGALNGPANVAVDSAGSVYIADTLNQVIRRFDGDTGTMTTIAGTGTSGYSGDSAVATSAMLASPQGVAVDSTGNVYIADTGNNRVRMVSAQTQKITTIAGNGTASYTGDNGPGTAATLTAPIDIAVDPARLLYIADSGNNVIRRVNLSTGIIATMAGTGTLGNTGDGTAATLAQLNAPAGIAYNPNGTVTFASPAGNVVRQINLATGIITTVAGTGQEGFEGDGGLATTAELQLPTAVAVDAAGNIYVADSGNSRVRRVDASSGNIYTVAGAGIVGNNGDAGSALAAQLNSPAGIALDGTANLYIADAKASVIRKVDVSRGATIAFGNQGTTHPSTTQILAVTNVGNQPLTTAPFRIAANFQLVGAPTGNDCAPGGTIAAGATCNVGITFSPAVAGIVTGSFIAINNNLNVTLATQATQLTGTGYIGANQFLIGGLSSQTTAGAPQSISITAANNGVPVTIYTGTVLTSTSDAAATLPPTYTFTAGDAGVHTFSGVVLPTAGTQTVTATDIADASITGTTTIQVMTGAAASLTVTGGSGQTAKTNLPYFFSLMAVAKDSLGNVVPGTIVTFAAPATGASGTFTGGANSAVVVTDSTGTATSPIFTANPILGSFTVLASAVGATLATFTLQNDPNHFTTALSLSFTPAGSNLIYGQPVTFNTTLSPVTQYSLTASGSVTFFAGYAQIASAPLTGAMASANVVPAGGAHLYTATYSGDTNFAGANAVPTIINVGQATATASGGAPLTLNYGQAGTANVYLAGQFTGAGIALPSGRVAYTINGTPTNAVLTTGVASLVIPATLPSGTYPIVAVYGGDTNYLAGGTTTFNLTVLKAATAATVTSSNRNSKVNTPVTLSATVSGAGTSNFPSGTITFNDGGSSLLTVTLSGGVATFTTTTLVAGNHTISVVYSGDADFSSATSAPVIQTVVGPFATALALNVAPAASTLVYGQPLTFTAMLSPLTLGISTATGSIAFCDANAQFSNVPLTASDTAIVPLPTIGLHSYTANYSGDQNFASANASPGAITVGQAAATASGAGAITLNYGQPGTANVNVAGQFSGAGIAIPTGIVTYTIGGGTPTRAVLTSTGATSLFIPATLAPGAYSIVATYGGDVYYMGGGATTLNLTVLKLATAITVASSNLNINVGSVATMTATLSTAGSTSVVPSGTVTFNDGVSPLGTTPLTGGVATYSTTLAAGRHSISVVYSGDAIFAGATSAPLLETIVGVPGGTATDPTVVSSSPANGATSVATSTNSSWNILTGTIVTATFSQPMDPTTIYSFPAGTLLVFTLKETATGNNVPGTVVMNLQNTVATFTPAVSALTPNTSYTATVTTAATNAGGTAMPGPIAWSFTTNATPSTGQAAVSLGVAGTFAILTESGITDVYASAVTGDVGTSPITGAALLLTCGEVEGMVYTVDAAGPLPCVTTNAPLLTAAVGDMGLAYADAASRTTPNFSELGTGEIGGLTLVPGLYKWSSGVSISADVTLSGGPNDVWIFQIAGTLNQANATRVNLTGGALAKNVFWQAADVVTIGTTAHFEGVVLAQTMIAVNTGASVKGRLFAQTAITLQQNAVTQPAP